MKCDRIALGDGTVAIVCTAGGRRLRCGCGNVSTLLCDWKTPTAKNPKKTCDAPLCPGCATEVGPEKHLCARHNDLWEARLGRIGDGPP